MTIFEASEGVNFILQALVCGLVVGILAVFIRVQGR